MKVYEKKSRGITLIALVITIILLLILAGITITQLTGSGLFGNAKKSKEISDYTSAKEIVQMKLMEIQVECIKEERDYTIVEIAKSMALDEGITIEKYYNSNTASIKTGVTENLVELKGIIVSVNQYSKYKFLIGESGEIEGVTIEKITDTFGKEEFKPVEEFEREILGITPGTGGSGNGEDKDNPQEETVDVPGVGDNVDISNPIEITTYMSIRSNSKNTLNLAEVENAQYLLKSKTSNVELLENVLIANNNADSKDRMIIQITGTYKGQSYINNLTVYVEPKNRTTVTGTIKKQDGSKEEKTEEAYAIYKAQDLVRLGELVNHNVVSKTNPNHNAKVMDNIDLSIVCSEEKGSWIPIGMYTGTFEKMERKSPYKGIFDGDKKIISNLYIDGENEAQGLFGYIDYASISKVILENNCYVSANRIVGGIVGVANNTIIEKCCNRGTVIGKQDNTGGIVGVSTENVEIIASYNIGTVTGNANVAGICSCISGTNEVKSEISYCYNLGPITGIGDNNANIAGICGLSIEKIIIQKCYNKGTIRGGRNISGICGFSIR